MVTASSITNKLLYLWEKIPKKLNSSNTMKDIYYVMKHAFLYLPSNLSLQNCDL